MAFSLSGMIHRHFRILRSRCPGLSGQLSFRRGLQESSFFHRHGVLRGGKGAIYDQKVTIVGIGEVGTATMYSILIKNLANPLILIDICENKVRGELKDFQHGIAMAQAGNVYGGTDYSLTANSKVCIITAGARQRPGQTRTDLLDENFEVTKNIVANLMAYSPDAFYIIATNPVDVLAYATWRITGLPLNKVIGTGTHLDSSRFKYNISQYVGVNVASVDACIIGEHGEHSVPCWSQISIAGQPYSIVEGLFTEPDKQSIHRCVVNSAQDIISLKGFTNWGIGIAIMDILEAIILNKEKLICVSTNVKDFYGVEYDVFCSLPCIVGANGISYVVPQHLSEDEVYKFRESVNATAISQSKVDDWLSC